MMKVKKLAGSKSKNYISATFEADDQLFCAEGVLSPTGILYNCNLTNGVGDELKTFSSTHYGLMLKEAVKLIEKYLEN